MILDASAAVDALVPTARSEAVWSHIERAPFLAAPQLLFVEVPSALWRLERSGALPGTATEASLARLASLRVDLLDHAALLPLAWGFRESTRLTDAFYLGAARALGVPLLTTDGRLARGHHGVPVVSVS